MLWLALDLPALPLEVFTRADAGAPPCVVYAGAGRVQAVLFANRAARARGVQPGMPLGAAQALVAALRTYARDTAAEQALLARLAAWAGQFTPQVSLAPPQHLLLEIAGSRTLFGGLAALCARIRAQIAALGFEAVVSVAPTPLAAIWLARAGREVQIIDTARLRGALAALPLTCMDATEAQRQILHGMGVRTIGDCLRLPRDGLARRLGADLIAMLDRALGRTPDPRPLYVAPSRYRGHLALPGTVDTGAGVLFALHRLLAELGGFLIARGAGVTALTLTLHHTQRATTDVALGLAAPTRDVEHLTALWRERLARVALPAPVEEITLRADRLVPLAQRARDLFAAKHAEVEARTALIERLKARLGDAAVQGLAQVAEHRPERAWRYVAPGQAGAGGTGKARPLWLLPSPLALEERGGQPCLGGVLALEGDRERIESGWWDDADVRRDYFIARSPQGARLWVYRELDGARRWFLHGVFA